MMDSFRQLRDEINCLPLPAFLSAFSVVGLPWSLLPNVLLRGKVLGGGCALWGEAGSVWGPSPKLCPPLGASSTLGKHKP